MGQARVGLGHYNRQDMHISREREDMMVQMLCEGMSRHEVADYMGITVPTLKVYLAHAFKVRNVHTMVELVIGYWTIKFMRTQQRPPAMEDFYGVQNG
jgi:DNA-binding CsgD family transcriptional regulator